MKTLLVNPPQRDLARGIYKERYIIREECAAGIYNLKYLPAQIFLAANYLRERGKDVDAIDAETSRVSLNGYDVVVVWAAVLGNFYRDIDFLRSVKEKGKKTVLILNDPYEGFEMEAMQRFGFIDAAVRLWEREVVLDKLLSKWGKEEQPEFKGVIYRKNGKIMDTGTVAPLSNLEHLRSCSKLLEELPLEKYESAIIIPGRGCPQHHSFCLFHRSGPRRRRVQDVISEFETISTGIKRVLIVHPAMITDRKWTKKFTDELVLRRLKVSWRADARIGDCSLLRLSSLRKAGCDTIMMGVESLDTEVAKMVKAGMNPKMLKKAILNLQRTLIAPMPVFYLGFLWDSNKTLLKIKKFLREVPIPHFQLRYARPWKGTPYYEDCKRLGVLKRDLELDDYVNSGLASPLVDTLYLTKDEITWWCHSIMRSAMFNPRFVLRALLEKREIKLRNINYFRLLKDLLGKHA